VTEEAPAANPTATFLTILLIVVSVGLVVSIGFILLRMCSRKRRLQPMQADRLQRQGSQPLQEDQYACDDAAKDIFYVKASRQQQLKVNKADSCQEVSVNLQRQSSGGKLQVPEAPVAVQDTSVEHQHTAADTSRGLKSSSSSRSSDGNTRCMATAKAIMTMQQQNINQ